MKKVYENLEIEVISFEKQDVITASIVPQSIDNGFSLFSTYGAFEDFFRS